MTRVPSAQELLNSLKSHQQLGAESVFVTLGNDGWAMHDYDNFDAVFRSSSQHPASLKFRIFSGVYPVKDSDLELVSQGLHDNLAEKLGDKLMRPAPA